MVEAGAPGGAHPRGGASPGSPGSEGWSRSALARRIFEILRDELLDVGPEFSPRSDLVEAGLDSLAVTQLLLSLEEETGVWVDESALTPEHLESAETLAALVHEKLRGA